MTLDRLTAIMRRLRDPVSGCEWDRVQTFATIAPYTIEEAYEVADAIERDSVWQFPAALAILVASKAYIVTRSSATPRLLPDGMTLVRANSRMSLAGVTGATIGGPLAGGAAAQMLATEALAPKVMDLLLAKVAIRAESTREKVPGGSPGNLDAPTSDDRVKGDLHGRPSVWTWLQLHPRARVVAATGALVAPTLVRRFRRA